MSDSGKRSYRFTTEAHWRAGARSGLRWSGGQLVLPDPLVLHPLPGARSSGAVLPAFDLHGRLLWLDPGTGGVSRRLPAERRVLGHGTVEGASAARRLVAGRSLLWAVTADGLLRVDALTLQRLTPPRPAPGWRLIDATGDGGDGLWVGEADTDGNRRLRHVDCWGRSCSDRVLPAGSPGQGLVLASTPDGSRVLALDPDRAEEFLVVDVGPATVRRIPLDPEHRRGRSMLASGPEDRVHVLSVPEDFGRGAREVLLHVIDPASGAVELRQSLPVPAPLGRPAALVGGPGGLALACSRGLAELVAEDGGGGARWATFVTPALVSPRRPRAGWDRAEIEAELPAGTSMTVTWTSTDEQRSAERTDRVLGTPSTVATAEALDRAVAWRAPGTTFWGTGGSAAPPAGRLGAGPSHTVLLSTVEDTTLWLRIDLRAGPGSGSPVLTGMRIRYPNTSYLDHLPAIYRENSRAAQDLREILAPYEVLLDGLDETLDALPDRISPTTRSEEWTDYLLGWLGFPPLTDLPLDRRRDLLAHAPGLLDARGTRAGLQRVLDIVTGGRAVVADSSDDPAGWFLGTGRPASAGAGPSRLGVDTVVLAQRPGPSRIGTAVLGRLRPGRACPDAVETITQHSRTVTITVHDGADRPVLESVLEPLLDTFVPAHCRIAVRWTGDRADTAGRLDTDFRLGPVTLPGGPGETSPASRLAGPARGRLGSTARLGAWPLPDAGTLAVPDRGARLDTGTRLL